MTQKPYLNLGCGKIILPDKQPAHHALVDAAIYNYPLWHNIDRNDHEGVHRIVDLFAYPWDLPDDSYDGALLSHFCEHIPHEIRSANDRPAQDMIVGDKTMHVYSARELWGSYQDGWWAFFAELYRVLTDGAIVHVLSPYAWSQGAITDPSHTRYLTEHTFMHSMKPDPDSPFHYRNNDIHYEMDVPPTYRVTELFRHLADDPQELQRAMQTRVNVVYELYVKLRVVK